MPSNSRQSFGALRSFCERPGWIREIIPHKLTRRARVAKLADAPDLGSGGAILRGSSPLPGTLKRGWRIENRGLRGSSRLAAVFVEKKLGLVFRGKIKTEGCGVVQEVVRFVVTCRGVVVF